VSKILNEHHIACHPIFCHSAGIRLDHPSARNFLQLKGVYREIFYI